MLLVLTAVVGTTVPVTGAVAGVDGSGTVQTESGDNVSVEFDENVYTTERGDSVTVTVRMDNTSVTALQIGDPDAGYALTAAVEDRNGDGTAVVVFDTGGGQQPLTTPDDGDTVRNVTRSGASADSGPGVGDYEIALAPGEKTTSRLARDDVEALATLSVAESQSDGGATAETTPSRTRTSSGATDTATDTGTSDGSGPGFGVVGALVAVVAAALVARRAQ